MKHIISRPRSKDNWFFEKEPDAGGESQKVQRQARKEVGQERTERTEKKSAGEGRAETWANGWEEWPWEAWPKRKA